MNQNARTEDSATQYASSLTTYLQDSRHIHFHASISNKNYKICLSHQVSQPLHSCGLNTGKLCSSLSSLMSAYPRPDLYISVSFHQDDCNLFRSSILNWLSSDCLRHLFHYYSECGRLKERERGVLQSVNSFASNNIMVVKSWSAFEIPVAVQYKEIVTITDKHLMNKAYRHKI